MAVLHDSKARPFTALLALVATASTEVGADYITLPNGCHGRPKSRTGTQACVPVVSFPSKNARSKSLKDHPKESM